MKDLDKRFEEAVKLASNPDLKFPPDIRLLFYAYYKRAMGHHHKSAGIINSEEEALISGFKMNAIFQAKNISIEDAKKNYIKLVDVHISKVQEEKLD